jgi:hypothetical protein
VFVVRTFWLAFWDELNFQAVDTFFETEGVGIFRCQLGTVP